MTDPDVPPSRERVLIETFALVADLMVADHEIADLLDVVVHRCVELFPVDAAGLLLRDRSGRLGLAATSSEASRLVEFLQLQSDEGACLDAYTSGEPVLVDDLSSDDRWPTWGPATRELGFRSVSSIPLRWRDTTIGALNMFREEVGHLRAEDLYAARTLAQIATTGILQHRALDDAEQLGRQLQTALDSRVVIEQAKGVLAERHGISLEQAFEQLRTEARRSRRKVGELAREITAGRP
ncbi:MAG TPA: GAF and ANTAR domain-containing protein [Mycobacteriales bacterium]